WTLVAMKRRLISFSLSFACLVGAVLLVFWVFTQRNGMTWESLEGIKPGITLGQAVDMLGSPTRNYGPWEGPLRESFSAQPEMVEDLSSSVWEGRRFIVIVGFNDLDAVECVWIRRHEIDNSFLAKMYQWLDALSGRKESACVSSLTTHR